MHPNVDKTEPNGSNIPVSFRTSQRSLKQGFRKNWKITAAAAAAAARHKHPMNSLVTINKIGKKANPCGKKKL